MMLPVCLFLTGWERSSWSPWTSWRGRTKGKCFSESPVEKKKCPLHNLIVSAIRITIFSSLVSPLQGEDGEIGPRGLAGESVSVSHLVFYFILFFNVLFPVCHQGAESLNSLLWFLLKFRRGYLLFLIRTFSFLFISGATRSARP